MVQATNLCNGKELCPGHRLRRLVGRGAYGHVWEAEVENRTVALKFLPCHEGSSVSHEIRSIQAVRQLKHPNLVRIEQLWCHRGYIVITMEMADGNLLDLLEAHQEECGGPLPAEQVCPLLGQGAAAIDFLNTRQHLINGQRVALLHGDIKPTNMLLFGDRVKLCDFGLSALTCSSLRSQQPAGTENYAAPEVWQGRLTPWSDQYALAVTYCLLRSGRFPFREPASGPQPTNGQSPLDLTMLAEPERPIIARALSPAPLDRWPSCQELMAQLSKIYCRGGQTPQRNTSGSSARASWAGTTSHRPVFGSKP